MIKQNRMGGYETLSSRTRLQGGRGEGRRLLRGIWRCEEEGVDRFDGLFGSVDYLIGFGEDEFQGEIVVVIGNSPPPLLSGPHR
jgi:hypothetical protein